MAGSVEAEKLIENDRYSGEVVKKGFFKDYNDKKINYIIIFLDDDTEILQRDHGSDIRISPYLDMGDRCELVKHDNYTFEWKKK